MKQCIGCGYCCRKGPCSLTRPEHGPWSHCDELRWDGERWVCGLYLDAAPEAAEKIARRLFFGSGCCMNLNDYARMGVVPTPEDLEDEEDLLRRLREGSIKAKKGGQ